MSRRLLIVLALASLVPSHLFAQHDGGGNLAASTVPKEGAQFAFLIGHWDVTVTPKNTSLAARIHGAPSFRGTWKAWKAFDGFGVEDELRVTDRSGNPSTLLHAMRSYDATNGRWTQAMLDVYRGRFTSGEGRWTNGEMTMTSTVTETDGKPALTRARFYDITPTAFKYQSDRSSDGGRTWDSAVLRMHAKRVAATAPR
ncbi:MAG: hypothetical protein ABI910_11040 [Gemmatimonadota bacterium]